MMFKQTFALAAFLASSVFLVHPAMAFEKMRGCFEATKSCPAYRSIRKKTNPGNLGIRLGEIYRLRGANKRAPTHYQIHLPGQSSPNRWVETSCGKVLKSCPTSMPAPTGKTAGYKGESSQKHNRNAADELLLAVSWQPAFCETHRKKPECAHMPANRFDAQNLALHGLWPQPRSNTYCGVSIKDKTIDRRKRWDLLARLELTETTRKELNRVMPGAQSHLQRHEWIKHGTCYSPSAEIYYRHSLDLMAQLNGSAVRDLFANNIGKSISFTDVAKAFDNAFGPGSGQRVAMRCDRKGRITDLWINLKGKINQGTRIADLLAKAPTTRTRCHKGIVDPAGFQ